MRCGGLRIVAAEASGSYRLHGWNKRTRRLNSSNRFHAFHIIRSGQMARLADAQVAREADFLIVHRSQLVRIREFIATMNAVNLRCIVHSLFQGAIYKGRIVANRAFLR